MNFLGLQEALETLVDWIVDSDPEDIRNYVNQVRSDNPGASNRQLSEIIINEQAFNSGILGAITGLGGLMTLPATIPIDIIKAWKIQAYTIRCIAYIYQQPAETLALKTDIFLILSNGSVEELKNFVIAEAMNVAPKHALQALNSLKKVAIKTGTKYGTKYAAKLITKYGGKTIVKYSMKGMSKKLVKVFWKVGGKKAVEKSLQKSIGKAMPVIGAVIGGGIDWIATQAVGNLAIEYYENNISDWVSDVFNVCEDNY